MLSTNKTKAKLPSRSADDGGVAGRPFKLLPMGERGLAGSRAAGYCAIPATEYVQLANAEAMLLVMIESVTAVNNIEAMAQVEGVGVLNIGSSGLSPVM